MTEQSRHIRKRPWITIGAITALLIAGCAISIPSVISANELSTAQADYAEASDSLKAAGVELENADTEKAERTQQAAREYTDFSAIAASIPADLVEPASALDEFAKANTAFIKSTGLLLAKDGTVAKDQPVVDIAAPVAPKPAETTEELRAQTKTITSDTKVTADKTAELVAETTTIDEKYADTSKALDGLVAAAAAKGKTLTFDKAGQPEKDAFAATVAGLVIEKDGKALTVKQKGEAIAAYVAARNAAQASHDATVAAEQAAAEAERQSNSNNSNSNSNSNNGTRSNSSNNSNSGGGQPSNPSGGGQPSNPVGGGTPPVSTPARGSVLKTGGSCIANYGSGGSSSGNWASSLVIPADSVVTGTSENPGVSWSVSFAC